MSAQRETLGEEMARRWAELFPLRVAAEVRRAQARRTVLGAAAQPVAAAAGAAGAVLRFRLAAAGRDSR